MTGCAMSIYDVDLAALDGAPLDLSAYAGSALLVVNVASQCGLTPQYGALQLLQEQYGERGFSVLGVPCNQFSEQEPGTPEEISEFCESEYSITFPLTEKLDVNGQKRHPLYRELTRAPDTEGEAGDVEWNFEKFLVSPAGEVVARFRPQTLPDAPEVISALESILQAR